MRCPVPNEFANKLNEIKEPLIFVAGVSMKDTNPKKQYSGQVVKIRQKNGLNGGWFVELKDDPRVWFEVHKEQLRIVRIVPDLGDYL